MSRKPLPSQVKALEYVAGRRHIALFMEMRLGKTMVAVRWAASHCGPGDCVLVVTYKDCTDGIEDEIRAEGYANVLPLYNMSSTKRVTVLNGYDAEWEDEPIWAIVNYEAMLAQPELFDLEWDVLVCDESTALRNPQSKTAKLFDKKAGRIPHRAILSGLPNPKNVMDFFQQFKILFGMFLGYDNYWIFREKKFYRPVQALSWLWNPRPGVRDEIKKELNKTAFMLTRKQAKVGGRFLVEKWVVDPSPKLKKCMRQVEDEFSLNGYDTNWATTRDIWLQRLAGGFDPNTLEQLDDAKTRTILAKIGDGGPLEGQPVLVWFRFNEELKQFAKAARKKKLRVCEIYGDIPSEERKRLRRAFQAGEYDVAAIQMSVGKFGQDWSRADVAIYYSHTYDTELWAQTRDRIVHPTQKRDLLLVNCVTRGTIDESVVGMQQEKYSDSKVYFRALVKDYVARLKKVARR